MRVVPFLRPIVTLPLLSSLVALSSAAAQSNGAAITREASPSIASKYMAVVSRFDPLDPCLPSINSSYANLTETEKRVSDARVWLKLLEGVSLECRAKAEERVQAGPSDLGPEGQRSREGRGAMGGISYEGEALSSPWIFWGVAGAVCTALIGWMVGWSGGRRKGYEQGIEKGIELSNAITYGGGLAEEQRKLPESPSPRSMLPGSE